MREKIIFWITFVFIFVCLLSLNPAIIYAEEITPEERTEQREFRVQDKKEDLLKKPETASDILQLLKERAQAKIKEERRKLLWKTKIAAGVKGGYETNPLNDQLKKSDYYAENEFTFNWLPTFNDRLSADFAFRLTHQSYVEFTDLSTYDHDFTATFKVFPFESHDFYIQPGGTYEWLNYPRDEQATYEDTKAFLKFKHYMDADWNYGGKYEYSYKLYDEKLARNDGKVNISGLARADFRNTVELYAAKNISKYTVKLKGKVYRNNSNDQYQHYYDYDAYRGYITLSGGFLKDDKLYLSFTPDFERKNYRRRIAERTARFDNVLQYKLDAYYTLSKHFELSYSYTHKIANSNAAAGEFENITNSIGVTYNF